MIITNLEGLFLRYLVHNLSTVADVIFGCRFVVEFPAHYIVHETQNYLSVGELAII